MLAVAAGIAVAVALIASIGSFVSTAKQTMTTQSISRVAVDWQIEAQHGADPAQLLDQVRHTAAVSSAASVEFAMTTGLESTADGASQTTGAGVVVGLPPDYARIFTGSIRPLIGATDGVLLPRQTAANLHAGPGSTIRITRPGLDDLAVSVEGVVELQQADSLFQRVGQPPSAQPQAPPDNVVLLPVAQWHQAFDALAIQRPDLVRHQVHVRLDRRLPSDPATALDVVQGAARHLDVVLAGAGVVGDNLAAALDSARRDAVYAQVLFLFLGLPGACIACVMAAAVAAVTADSRRTEQALLRARGASTATLVRVAAVEGLAVGAIGAAAGVATGYVAARWLLDSSHNAGGLSFNPAWNVGAALAGVVVAVAMLAAPAWRDARQLTVASARRILRRRWRRPALVGIGVGLAALGAWIYYVTIRRGYTLVFAPEGVPGISVSYWALAGPVALWVAAAVLTREVAAFVVDRGRGVFARVVRPVAGNLASTVAATMQRQRMVIARTLMLISLTVAFAASTSAFNRTYQQQADVDAKFTNGADVTAASANRQGFAPEVGAQLSTVPGVSHVEPLQHRYAYVGTDLQDLFGVRPSSIVDATRLQDSYFTGGSARDLMDRLVATPDGVLVSAEAVHDYQMQVGDHVVLRVQPDQDGDPISVTFHYLGVVNEFPTAPRDSFIIANADYITTMTGHNGTDTYLLDTKGASPASVASTVRAMAGPAAVVSDITTSRNVVGSTLTAVDLSGLTRIELAFALLLIVGATGLALALGLTERRLTFAIATALGATRRQVGGFLWAETSFVTIVGIALGLLVAWAMTNVLVTVLAGVFDPPPQAPVVPWSYLGAILACAAVAVIIGTTVAIRIARRSPLAMLRVT
jgi:putative ABC transport system permease protein